MLDQILFEIFASQDDADVKNSNCDNLLGYPNEETDTDRYRDLFKHNTEELWAGVIDYELESACSHMNHEEKLPYYDDSDLKTFQYLIDNDWFPIIEA